MKNYTDQPVNGTMKEQFNLSNKGYNSDEDGIVYPEDDVKEFIRLLKEELNPLFINSSVNIKEALINQTNAFKIIDKLAGSSLLGTNGEQ